MFSELFRHTQRHQGGRSYAEYVIAYVPTSLSGEEESQLQNLVKLSAGASVIETKAMRLWTTESAAKFREAVEHVNLTWNLIRDLRDEVRDAIVRVIDDATDPGHFAQTAEEIHSRNDLITAGLRG